MKYLKMLGLAAVAAMALMAFVGAGSSSATVLCKTTVTPCPTSPVNERVTEIHGVQVGTGTLKNTAGEVLDECKAATLQGKISSQGASVTASASIGGLYWSECTSPTTTVANGTLELHHLSGGHNGTVTASGTEVTINGIFGVSCTYGVGTGLTLGPLKGGTTPELNVDTIVNKTAGGFVCPSHGRWKATFHLTESTYVVAS